MNYYVRDDIQDISDTELQMILLWIPAWRREEALRFKHRQGQLECALSYMMLCQCISVNYGFDCQPHFVIGEHGKPTLKEYPDIHFNISHCKKAIAVAVNDSPIGIDVECIGRENDSLARYVLNDDELHQMEASEDPSALFAKYWTQKEAVFKFYGSGIRDDIKNLLVNSDDVKITTTINKEKGYALSIAIEK